MGTTMSSPCLALPLIHHCSPFYKSDSRQAVNHVTEVVEHLDSNRQVVVF